MRDSESESELRDVASQARSSHGALQESWSKMLLAIIWARILLVVLVQITI